MSDQEIEREVVEEIEAEEEELERQSSSLLWVSSLASFLGWLVLVIFVLIVGITVYGSISSGLSLRMDLQSVYTVLNWLLLLSVGASLFVILQAVARGILVLLDIQDRVYISEEL